MHRLFLLAFKFNTDIWFSICLAAEVLEREGGFMMTWFFEASPIVVREDMGRRYVITLIICNDFYTIILPHATKEYISTE